MEPWETVNYCRAQLSLRFLLKAIKMRTRQTHFQAPLAGIRD